MCKNRVGKKLQIICLYSSGELVAAEVWSNAEGTHQEAAIKGYADH